MAVIALFIIIFKFCAETSLTNDNEYWTTYIVEARYYESWDEWIEKTCSYKCCCDSKGNNCQTVYYDCSYREYHSAYWEVVDNTGKKFNISESKYKELVRKFGMKPLFVDMHRYYDLNDGDMYKTLWPKTDETIDVIVTRHTYENRIQASHSVFNFPEVDSTDINRFKLYEYPVINHRKQDHLLGLNDKEIERKLEILNAKLGAKKQLKLFIALYDGTDLAAESQRNYWKGGNKNEFIVCMNYDKQNNKAKWVKIISWNKNKTVNIKVRNWIMKNDNLQLGELVDYLYTELQDFDRQEFEEFNYLKVELTSGQQLVLWIVSFILSVLGGIWIVMNPIEEYNNNSSRLYNYYHRRF